DRPDHRRRHHPIGNLVPVARTLRLRLAARLSAGPPRAEAQWTLPGLDEARMQYPEWIWHNGAIKRWEEATTHVMAHALHYGSSVFEGIRSYDTPSGPAIFRLTDHNRSEEHTSELQSRENLVCRL